MSQGLVRTNVISVEDREFFQSLADKTELFWRSPKSRNQSEEEFFSQGLPDVDLPNPDPFFRDLSALPSVAEQLQNFSDKKGFWGNTNAVVYSPMSLMRWHTNSNNPGLRHYFTHTTGRAIFRWRHPKTGEIFDEIDGEGWTYRTFVISPTQPIWHTIWTEEVRLSFGFNSAYAATQLDVVAQR
jgi:hypothetical protein